MNQINVLRGGAEMTAFARGNRIRSDRLNRQSGLPSMERIAKRSGTKPGVQPDRELGSARPPVPYYVDRE